jgi:hypothetical protein
MDMLLDGRDPNGRTGKATHVAYARRRVSCLEELP